MTRVIDTRKAAAEASANGASSNSRSNSQLPSNRRQHAQQQQRASVPEGDPFEFDGADTDVESQLRADDQPDDSSPAASRSPSRSATASPHSAASDAPHAQQEAVDQLQKSLRAAVPSYQPGPSQAMAARLIECCDCAARAAVAHVVSFVQLQAKLMNDCGLKRKRATAVLNESLQAAGRQAPPASRYFLALTAAYPVWCKGTLSAAVQHFADILSKHVDYVGSGHCLAALEQLSKQVHLLASRRPPPKAQQWSALVKKMCAEKVPGTGVKKFVLQHLKLECEANSSGSVDIRGSCCSMMK